MLERTHARRKLLRISFFLAVGLAAIAIATSCKSTEKAAAPDATAADAASTTTKESPAEEEKDTKPRTALPPGEPVHEGSAVALAREGDRLYIADEDHSTLRILPLEAEGNGGLPKTDFSSPDGGIPVFAHPSITLPGRPANVVVTKNEVLVTVRDPGLLMIFKREGASVVETGRVPLPADAWGVAVNPDEKLAIVTSAWTHQVSSVDLEAKKVIFSIDVGREPRGVVVRADGAGAYVSHLVSTNGDLTRIDNLRDEKPKVRMVKLPPARLRTDKEVRSSLGYALTLSKDGSRLYVPRHALGALGDQAWFGATTVDVLLTKNDEPLAPKRIRGASAKMRDAPPNHMLDTDGGPYPLANPVTFVEPRTAQIMGDKLFILSEGMHAIFSTSPTAIDPGLVASNGGETKCGAPAGMAISPDSKHAWVFCRAPYDLEVVTLYSAAAKREWDTTRRLAEDTLSKEAREGRAIFHNAADPGVSGGLACAACHPEGRDDGHVWHEIETRNAPFDIAPSVEPRIFAGGEDVANVKGFPRQTPMLVGRVKAEGPYGWHAENPDLRSRIEEGIHLHRWNAGNYDEEAMGSASKALAAFLRQGLVAPPREKRALNEVEQKGKKIFESDETACATCHAPAKDFTDRAPRVLKPWPATPGFDDEQSGIGFKPPSLLFVAGSAPYYHDGSSPTLEDVIDNNKDRMGKTSHLSAQERAALVAYLRTL